MMSRVSLELSETKLSEIDRLVREGWFEDRAAVVTEALDRFLDGKSLLGDSPRLLLQFAADALNDSRPETALKFVERGMTLLMAQSHPDLALYRSLVELRVQVLLVLERTAEALATLEEARQRLPNHPGVNRWLEQLERQGIRNGKT